MPLASKFAASPEKLLEQSLKEGKPSNVYLFHGSENNRLKAAIDIVRRYVEKVSGSEEVAWTAYDLAETGFHSFLSDIKTVSFFGGTRGVYAFNFALSGPGGGSGEYKLPEDEQNAILAYLEKPSPDVILVLRPVKVDLRLKFWKSLKEKSFEICFETAEKDRTSIIEEKLKETGLAFSPQARGYVIERFSSNFTNLLPELEKLVTYMGDKREVSLADLEDCMSFPKKENIWQLTDSVIGGNAQKALESLKSLKLQGESNLMVLPMVAREFRLILFCKDGSREGLSIDETAKKYGLKNSWPLKKYWGTHKSYPYPLLVRFLHQLYVTDLSMKRSRADDWVILEKEILSFITSNAGAKGNHPSRF